MIAACKPGRVMIESWIMIRIEHETDIERLREVARIQERENALLRRRLDALTARLAQANGVEQQVLLAAELAAVATELGEGQKQDGLASQSERRRPKSDDGQPPRQRTDFGSTPQPHLVHVKERLELDEPDRVCPECGGELRPIEGLFETSELVDRIEVQYIVRRVEQQKYRCSCSSCQHLEAALPSEDRLVAGGRYSIDFAIGVALDKYLMHLPLARQARAMANLGLEITSQTLWDQLWALVSMLVPSWYALHDLQLRQSVLGADETRWRLLEQKALAKPQIITLTSEQAIYYAFEMDKTAETIDRLLGDYSGWLVVDGISMYPALWERRKTGFENGTRAGPPFELANCWFHARRNFVRAERDFAQAGEMLELIARLYRIEAGARLEAVETGVRRQWLDTILEGMRAWMRKANVVPGTSLAQAIEYMRKYWVGLTRFVEHPEVWLDNNASERALRAAVLGRKNHYGSKSERGMLAAAVLYSLIETCQLIGVDPRTYLREAVRRAKSRPGSAMLPHELLKPNSADA
jgi:transposase